MLAMVARSADAHVARPSPKNSTNFSTTPWLRRICVTVSTRSVAVAPSGSWPCSLKPTTCGREHVDRLAEHAGLGLDAADAPADDAQAVDHGGVAVGADEANRGRRRRRGPSTTLARYSRLTWWHDAGGGRDDAEVVEGLLAPLEELVALAVALELHVDVVVHGIGLPKSVDLHGVVDDQVDGDQRVDLAGGRRRRASWRSAWPPGRRRPGRR